MTGNELSEEAFARLTSAVEARVQAVRRRVQDCPMPGEKSMSTAYFAGEGDPDSGWRMFTTGFPTGPALQVSLQGLIAIVEACPAPAIFEITRKGRIASCPFALLPGVDVAEVVVFEVTQPSPLAGENFRALYFVRGAVGTPRKLEPPARSA